MASQQRTPRPAARPNETSQGFRPIGIPAVAAAAEVVKPKAKPEPARAMPPGVKNEWH
jgi:hypothetical protein